MLCNHFTYGQSTVRPYALYTSVWILYHVIIGLLGVFAQRWTSRCVSENQHVHNCFPGAGKSELTWEGRRCMCNRTSKSIMVFSPNLPT